MTDSTALQDPSENQPTIDFEQLRQDTLNSAEARAREIAQQTATAATKQALIDTLIGKTPDDEDKLSWEREGRENPSDWKEATKEIEERTTRKVREELKKAEQEREATKKAQEEKQAKSFEEYRSKILDKLDSLETEGKLPAVPDEIKQKIRKSEKLTDEERNHPGVQERWRLQQAALDKNEPDVELAYYKYYKPSAPVGATAPVFGAQTASAPVNNEEFSYEDIMNARLRKDPTLLFTKQTLVLEA